MLHHEANFVTTGKEKPRAAGAGGGEVGLEGPAESIATRAPARAELSWLSGCRKLRMGYRSGMRQPLVALMLLSGLARAAEPITGRASVTDGDTVVIHGTRIRLYGIDATESAQLCQDAAGKDYRCGQRAALALADRIGEAPISCEPRDLIATGAPLQCVGRALRT